MDVLVWFGLSVAGEGWITQTAVPIRQRLFASTSYLEVHGTPTSVEEVRSRDLLAWLRSASATPDSSLGTDAAPPHADRGVQSPSDNL